ncbi:MAG: DUF1553 domain-containing protein [Planctomycetota bacterium]|nr:DUF1553 domain-containing protein [Planctomycetota bacterium]
MPRPFPVLSLAILAFPLLASPTIADDRKGLDYFEKYVRPLLVNRCLKCHSIGSESIGGNLLLDSRQGWTRGGDLGPAIQPGSPAKSLLMDAILHRSDDLEMPPDGKLSPHEIGILQEWIRMGAPDPRNGKASRQKSINFERGREFWAFQPLGQHPPKVPDAIEGYPSGNQLDRFLQTRQAELGFPSQPTASRPVLIRRLKLGLLGLPPDPDEVEQFVNDPSADAYEKRVDRYLASPRYGEVWGRHWLDVARYADSNGLDENIAYGNAWRYRDYVIRSMNADKPFDQFTREQLAGDLLASERKPVHENNDPIIATGFLSLGPKVLAEVDETKMEMDIVDEQVDTVGRVFLAVTLGCARCHDHKFDPISTRDYYAMAGIFKSTRTMEHFRKIARWNEVSLATQQQKQAWEQLQKKLENRQEELKANIRKEQARSGQQKETGFSAAARKNLETLRKKIAELEAAQTELPTAMSVTDLESPVDLRVHIRGNHLTLGENVPRGFPRVLGHSGRLPENQSGRLELANWLVSPKHPLVARVIVNRIWRWHFGRGIVESTDNFGKLGSRPTHPELLDWLAWKLIESEWSIKSLHRLILTSRTYQLTSRIDGNLQAKDDENLLQGRTSIRRMEAEAIRDSLLFVAGRLDLRMGGSQLHVKNREFLFDHTSKDLTRYDARTRSVYLPVIRNHLYDVFQLFDYSDASVTDSNRSSTTVAPQALFLMNSEFSAEISESLADRILASKSNPASRHRLAYQIAFSREPTYDEISRDRSFLREMQNEMGQKSAWNLFCQTILMSNEFLYIR